MFDTNDIALAAVIAKKYYIGRLTKSEIGEQLYVSRFKVARLLELAVERGIVKFTIDPGGDANQNLADQVRSVLRLKRVVVVDDGPEQEVFTRAGHAVVGLLSDIVQPGDYVGLSSTRSLMGLATIESPVARATFVQLNGSISRPDAMDIIDGIRKLTNAAGGRAHVFYAPLVAPSKEMWRNYQQQPDARNAFSKFDQLAVTVAGIGRWQAGLSVSFDNLSPEVTSKATAAGAVHEILGVPVDASGHTVNSAARQRIVAPDAELLSGVPTTIGVAIGKDKADSAAALARAGLVNCLVTHRALAEHVVGG